MSVAALESDLDGVLAEICKRGPAYPNVAVLAFHSAMVHQEFGLSCTAKSFLSLADQLITEELSPTYVSERFSEILGDNTDSTMHMLRYLLEVDLTVSNSFHFLEMDCRKNFLRMSFELAEDRYYDAQTWAQHIVASAVSAEVSATT